MRRYSVVTANASADIRVFGDVNVSCRMRPMSLVGNVVDCSSSSDSGPSELSRRGGMVHQRNVARDCAETCMTNWFQT